MSQLTFWVSSKEMGTSVGGLHSTLTPHNVHAADSHWLFYWFYSPYIYLHMFIFSWSERTGETDWVTERLMTRTSEIIMMSTHLIEADLKSLQGQQVKYSCPLKESSSEVKSWLLSSFRILSNSAGRKQIEFCSAEKKSQWDFIKSIYIN